MIRSQFSTFHLFLIEIFSFSDVTIDSTEDELDSQLNVDNDDLYIMN